MAKGEKKCERHRHRGIEQKRLLKGLLKYSIHIRATSYTSSGPKLAPEK